MHEGPKCNNPQMNRLEWNYEKLILSKLYKDGLKIE